MFNVYRGLAPSPGQFKTWYVSHTNIDDLVLIALARDEVEPLVKGVSGSLYELCENQQQAMERMVVAERIRIAAQFPAIAKTIKMPYKIGTGEPPRLWTAEENRVTWAQSTISSPPVTPPCTPVHERSSTVVSSGHGDVRTRIVVPLTADTPVRSIKRDVSATPHGHHKQNVPSSTRQHSERITPGSTDQHSGCGTSGTMHGDSEHSGDAGPPLGGLAPRLHGIRHGLHSASLSAVGVQDSGFFVLYHGLVPGVHMSR